MHVFPPLEHAAASVDLGSEQSFAAFYAKVRFGSGRS